MNEQPNQPNRPTTPRTGDRPASTPRPTPNLHPATAANKQSLVTPIAIVVGFGLIALAIYFSGVAAPNAPSDQIGAVGGAERDLENLQQMLPVDENDHIRGNPNAPIMLVEYSDYDCPFCKNFHETMSRIMNEYGLAGKVAWTYRHFPLTQIHPNAPRIAHAAECVAELGGNEAFWEFTDLIFAERGSNEPTNVSRLSTYANRVGVDVTTFNECEESGRHQERVAEDFASGRAAGAQGTPHTVVIVGDQQATINGAQPYQQVRQIIENLLAQLEGRPLETPTN